MSSDESEKLKRDDIIINIDENQFLKLYEYCKVYISIDGIIFLDKTNNGHPLLKCYYKSFMTLNEFNLKHRKDKINKIL